MINSVLKRNNNKELISQEKKLPDVIYLGLFVENKALGFVIDFKLFY